MRLLIVTDVGTVMGEVDLDKYNLEVLSGMMDLADAVKAVIKAHEPSEFEQA